MIRISNLLFHSLILISLMAFTAQVIFIPQDICAITLDECIVESLNSSPDIEAASSRIKSSQAIMKQARSAYYPWVTFSTSYTRTDNPPQAFMMSLNQRDLNMMDPNFDPNDPDDTENIRMSLGFKYQVYNFGRRGFERMDEQKNSWFDG